MLETLIGFLATWIIATISAIGYVGIVAADGDRVRLHPAAVRDHHAVLGLSRLDRPLQSAPGRHRRRDRLQSRLDHRLCGRLFRRPAAGREMGPLCPDRAGAISSWSIASSRASAASPSSSAASCRWCGPSSRCRPASPACRRCSSSSTPSSAPGRGASRSPMSASSSASAGTAILSCVTSCIASMP